MKFTKMHGLGNDYVYINCNNEKVNDPSALSRRISDRHFGIGSDGLILIKPSIDADFRMEMFNADGSEGEMCGNALRCVGKYVHDKGLTEKTDLAIETQSGIKYLSLKLENNKTVEVTADVGMPEFDSKIQQLCLATEMPEYINVPTKVGDLTMNLTVVNIGNPHVVTFVEDVDAFDLLKIGPLIENHKLFPKRINCEFVEIINGTTIKMRVWERGSGETLACGTGACASVVASIILNKVTGSEICVILRGGNLKVKWSNESNRITMSGPAAFVFDGELLD